VPTGTDFELIGYIAGDAGAAQWIDITNGDLLGSSFRVGRASIDPFVVGATDVVVPEPGIGGLLAMIGF
jgi:hypothetical protein